MRDVNVTTPTEEAFRKEVLAFLDDNAERKSVTDEPFRWGEGDDDVALFDEIDPSEEAAAIQRSKEWRAARFDAGLGWISGPGTYGGRGLPRSYERIYLSTEAGYAVPSNDCFRISLGMVAPTILEHAVDTVKDRYLPGLHRGDIIAAQLFSEPGAGSDLASLQMRAERDGDQWVLNGQKVWTSGAQYCDIGEVLCRTAIDKPKHRGITAFVVDLNTPGIEVRPLRQMTGGASFNEVFFDAVRVPADHRLGDVDDGWTVALTTLMNERATIGGGGGGQGNGISNGTRLIEMMKVFDAAADPVLRQDLARIYSGFQVAKWNARRAMAKVAAGERPGAEMSGTKLALTANMANVSEVVSKILGPRIQADTGEWGTFAWQQFLLGVPGIRIAGGTDEVLRKIIGEQVLGLPKEPGIDTTSPFRDLAQN